MRSNRQARSAVQSAGFTFSGLTTLLSKVRRSNIEPQREIMGPFKFLIRLVRYCPPSLPKASFGRPLYSGVKTPISASDRRSPADKVYWGWNASSSAFRSRSPFLSSVSEGKSKPTSAAFRSPAVWFDGSLACGVSGRDETGPGAGVGEIVGAGLAGGAGAGSPNPGGRSDSGDS